ncbi:protein njmu-r1 [Anaeramoeba flamelloides]|uniref:Protein njmu-r1 n=1 Tax=Anaeramoeba flamelloides TaxID=1746091 RepID=A0ABQ8YZ15_9EUKA|nr:protein njmu-r1 [Anaeramoeba flamelloides]
MYGLFEISKKQQEDNRLSEIISDLSKTHTNDLKVFVNEKIRNGMLHSGFTITEQTQNAFYFLMVFSDLETKFTKINKNKNENENEKEKEETNETKKENKKEEEVEETEKQEKTEKEDEKEKGKRKETEKETENKKEKKNQETEILLVFALSEDQEFEFDNFGYSFLLIEIEKYFQEFKTIYSESNSIESLKNYLSGFNKFILWPNRCVNFLVENQPENTLAQFIYSSVRQDPIEIKGDKQFCQDFEKFKNNLDVVRSTEISKNKNDLKIPSTLIIDQNLGKIYFKKEEKKEMEKNEKNEEIEIEIEIEKEKEEAKEEEKEEEEKEEKEKGFQINQFCVEWASKIMKNRNNHLLLREIFENFKRIISKQINRISLLLVKAQTNYYYLYYSEEFLL